MKNKTLYIHKRESNWIPESYESMKVLFSQCSDGVYKLLIQEVKRTSGWRYKFHFGHVLPLICEYMNRNGINTLIDQITGEVVPIDVETLHEYHKQMFNPGLVKNVLKKKDGRGNVPEFIVVPMSTTKLNDGEFINRFEEQIMATYANEYGIEFLSRDEFRQYFEDGKDSRMIVEMQMEFNQ